MPELAATFRKPFAEQVAAWRLRLGELRPTYGSADPAYAGHDRAFMVAGAVKADLLADLAAAVDRAVVDGTGFEAFKQDFRSIVERRGWHGWAGEGSVRGEEWRMRTIYRTNMQTSYMAGRHAQLVDGEYRWWVYRHSGAAHPRLNHLSWDGVALPPDHPFWGTHYPPNGWGCGCLVEGARTEAGIRRAGGDPGKKLPEGWQSADPRTGTPVGVGKGWAHAPGDDQAQVVLAMRDKLPVLPAPIGAAFAASWPEAARRRLARAFADFVQRAALAPPTKQYFEIAALKPSWLEGLAAQGVLPKNASISIRDTDIHHMLRTAKTNQMTLEDISALPELLEHADVGYLDLQDRLPTLMVYLIERQLKLILKIDFTERRRGATIVTNLVRSGHPARSTAVTADLGRGFPVIFGKAP
ncbi:phage minor head protein [Oceaniglobus trochenteri]|uniref:phage head morphogenesis protein n=1 Tax=Oceaniglobus trochenteri TaxID=2763260 RepID=UPI001D000688|nr:phage minor head protein [Oceaniglobus trochenteri]